MHCGWRDDELSRKLCAAPMMSCDLMYGGPGPEAHAVIVQRSCSEFIHSTFAMGRLEMGLLTLVTMVLPFEVQTVFQLAEPQ